MIVAGEPSTDDSASPTFDPRQPAPAMADSAQPDAAFPAPPPQQPDFKPIDVKDAHDVLLLLGVEPSHLKLFSDGEPLSGDEEDSLYKMLYAARRFPLSQLEAFTRQSFNVGDLVANLAKARGEIFPLSGYVTRATIHEPLPEVAERYLMPRYYECQVELDNNVAATIYTPTIPNAWPLDQDIREPMSARGIFVKLAADTEAANSSHPIFVAQRIAWHPDSYLGRLGMDMSLFDQVQQRKTLLSEDRECFYQLLNVAEQFDASQLLAAARETQERLDEAAQHKDKREPSGLAFTIGQLLKKPEEYAGAPFDFTGLLKRAIKIRVTDKDIRERFGIDHYYELQVLLDLEYVVRDGQRDHRFYNFPITVCVRELPEGIREGERLREFVRVPAVLMKIWSYQSEFAKQQGEEKAQIGPLFIGRTIGWIRPAKSTNSLAGMIAAALFLTAVGGILFTMWRYNQTDRRFRQRTKELHAEEPDLSGLSDLEQGRS